MTELADPVSLKSTVEYGPSEVISTGYDVADLTICHMLAQGEDGYGLGATNNLAYRPSAQLGGTPQDEASTDVNFLLYLFKTLGDCWDFIQNALMGAWPTLADYDALEQVILDYRYGARRQELRPVQEDLSSAATTLEHKTKALNWKDDDAGTTDMHHTKIRAWIWASGVRDSKTFPKLTESITGYSSITSTSWDRSTEILGIKAYIEYVYRFILYPFQAERAALAVGALRKGLLPRKVDADKLASPLHELWFQITRPNKYDMVGSSLSSDNYVGMTGDFWDFSLLDASTMDEYLQRLQSTWLVPSAPLNFIRKTSGIGLREVKERGNYETVHFGFLVNYAQPVGSAYTDHSYDKWYVGPNLSIGIDLLDDLRQLSSDFIALVETRKHKTWLDLVAPVKDMWVPFNITESLNGFCDPLIYKATRRQFNFADGTKAGSAGILYRTGPLGVLSSTLYTTTLFDVDEMTHADWWKYVLIWQGQDPQARLFVGSNWTMAELTMDMAMGMLFEGDTYSGYPSTQKFTWRRIRYVNMMEFRTVRTEAYITGTSTNSIPRFEDYPDYLGSSILQMKYGVWLGSPVSTIARIWSAARPKGFVEHHPHFMEHFGLPETKLSLIEMMFSHEGTNSPTRTSPKPDQKTSAPAGVDAVDKVKAIETAAVKTPEPKKVPIAKVAPIEKEKKAAVVVDMKKKPDDDDGKEPEETQ